MTKNFGKAKLDITVKGCMTCGTEWSSGWSVGRTVSVAFDGKSPIDVDIHLCARCSAPGEEAPRNGELATIMLTRPEYDAAGEAYHLPQFARTSSQHETPAPFEYNGKRYFVTGSCYSMSEPFDPLQDHRWAYEIVPVDEYPFRTFKDSRDAPDGYEGCLCVYDGTTFVLTRPVYFKTAEMPPVDPSAPPKQVALF
jgi:hypothetical protein